MMMIIILYSRSNGEPNKKHFKPGDLNQLERIYEQKRLNYLLLLLLQKRRMMKQMKLMLYCISSHLTTYYCSLRKYIERK